MSAITLAIQPFLDEPALLNDEPALPKTSNLPLDGPAFPTPLQELATALAQAQEWQEAERVARSTEKGGSRALALQELATALAQTQKWQEAERVARSIENDWYRALALQELATALAQAQEWQEAERVARLIENDWSRAAALQELATALAQTQKWQETERIAYSIENDWHRALALRNLASALTQAGEREQAQPLWQEAERIARSLENDWALPELAAALAQAQEWQEAERVARLIEEDWKHATALRNLASALAQAGEREQAQSLWQETERNAYSLEEDWEHALALPELATALAQAQEWQEAEQVAYSIEDKASRATALRELASALAQAGEREQAQPLWQEAERVILSIPPRSSPPSTKKPSSTPPSWDQIANDFLKSPEIDIYNLVGTTITVTTALIAIYNVWSRKQNKNKTSSQSHPSQLPELEIEAVRLIMNRGPEKKSSSEMITDPEQLKGWINLLNSSSSDIKPLVAIIVTKDETKHFYNLPEDMHELIKFLEFVQSSDRMPEKGLPKEHNDSPYPSLEEKHEGEETNHHEEGGTESMKT